MPATPAAAYDAFLPQAITRARTHRDWTPADGPLPALYLSHGAPPLFDDGPWMSALFDWAQSLPKPRSIVIVSAHWETAPLMISSSDAHTPLVYDFGGFDRRYYEMRYDTPDATALAHRIAGTMPDNEPLYQHPARGLDHGAWVPLMAMYPLADIPVLQLSMPTHDPERLLALGARLRSLRAEGTLIIGSGFMTHGMRSVTRDMILHNRPPSWSTEFDSWVSDALSRGDVDALSAWTSRAPGLPFAHPTPDHFTPLFITLGAADAADRTVRTTIDGYMMGFSRRSFETIA
jgi:4,5-DOPA dioxygenase extradiol